MRRGVPSGHAYRRRSHQITAAAIASPIITAMSLPLPPGSGTDTGISAGGGVGAGVIGAERSGVTAGRALGERTMRVASAANISSAAVSPALPPSARTSA